MLERLMRRGRVSAIMADNGFAFVFEDQFGEWILTAYAEDGPCWAPIFQVDDASPPAEGDESSQGGWTEGYAWLLGRVPAARLGAVTIQYNGDRFDVAPDTEGRWVWIREAPDPETPRLIPRHQA